MKTKLTLLVILFFFSIGLNAQNTTNKIKTHKVWVTLVDGSKAKGILYSANEAFIKITNNNSFDVSNLISIEASKVDIIKIRRKGQVGKGAWVGALSGAGLGVLLGFASGDDDSGFISFTKEEKAIAGGVVLSVLGTGVGALTATVKKKIIINGNIEIYKSQLAIIKSYSLIPN